MNKEQFIKQHPGLEGKGSGNGSYTSFHFLTIQDTQLDKQIVKEAIENSEIIKQKDEFFVENSGRLDKARLLKELKLE